ncbi:hypothetical protein [Urbifossiella limnaea]|uniref:Uncharacterized protein n=1 Tax=Urbifossiella limnaea TaxID=2528023 RepID=A0A517XZ97_9BACT|nr:hypothetical protein [Urbifossiella limnaea]QDU22832.1 hypothetical protein ETAA1_48200 [Urbifossiella limnaea]
MQYATGLLLLTAPAVAAQPPATPAPAVRVVVPATGTLVVPTTPTPLPPLRGPFRVRAATVMTHVVTDMTVQMFEAIPRAVAESVKRGDFRVEFGLSVTPPAPPAPDAAPPAPNPPVRGLLRRLAAPRP